MQALHSCTLVVEPIALEQLCDHLFGQGEGQRLLQALLPAIAWPQRSLHAPVPHCAGVPPSKSQLSARELTVLSLIAQGLSNQEVAERLFISLHTVKTHARKINCKLGVERRTQAVAQAKVMGLLV